MTAVEILNMSLEEQAMKVWEIVDSNTEAMEWCNKNMKYVSDGKFSTKNFFEMFLAIWTN